MIFIAIENGKIVDICNPLNNKITSIPDEDYYLLLKKVIGGLTTPGIFKLMIRFKTLLIEELKFQG